MARRKREPKLAQNCQQLTVDFLSHFESRVANAERDNPFFFSQFNGLGPFFSLENENKIFSSYAPKADSIRAFRLQSLKNIRTPYNIILICFHNTNIWRTGFKEVNELGDSSAPLNLLNRKQDAVGKFQQNEAKSLINISCGQ